MPRANRNFCKGYVWHITQRCHRKSFLLKFARDRRRWRHWLFEARRRHKLSVLNYIVTSNHIHLLCADRGTGEISQSMQLVSARTAQEFNNRKSRKGAFWDDRYHATAVQTDSHLLRCITYIDLNMVRAGAVEHPGQWDACGYNELRRPWTRKGIIDFECLMKFLNVGSMAELVDLQNEKIAEEIASTRRDSKWTESVAVGDERFLQEIKAVLGCRAIHREISADAEAQTLRESRGRYFAFLAPKLAD